MLSDYVATLFMVIDYIVEPWDGKTFCPNAWQLWNPRCVRNDNKRLLFAESITLTNENNNKTAFM